MLKFALTALFITSLAVETKSWSVTTLAVVAAIYISVQDKINRDLMLSIKDILDVSHAITESQKASIATQHAYANHVSDLRKMVLSMNGVRGEMNVRPNATTRPNWVPEDDYE